MEIAISSCRDAPPAVEGAHPSGEIAGEIAEIEGEIAGEIAEIEGEIEGEIAGEIAGEIEGEIAAPLPLLRIAWLRGELPREPGSAG